MSGRPWYKRYPSDFIAGTVHLTAEEKGVYSTLLDLLYLKLAPIEDDGKELARICGCSTRRFNAIKKTLVEAGKIVLGDGKISNPRFERQSSVERQEADQFEQNGRNGGEKSAKNRTHAKAISDGFERSPVGADPAAQNLSSIYRPEKSEINSSKIEDKFAENRTAGNEIISLDRKGLGSQNQPYSDTQILRKKEEERGGAFAPAAEPPIFAPPERTAGKAYAFEGETIRLSKQHFDKWRESFRAIPDLRAELQAADDYYTENPPRDGKWFFPVSRWLAKANAEASERREQRNYGVTWQ